MTDVRVGSHVKRVSMKIFTIIYPYTHKVRRINQYFV